MAAAYQRLVETDTKNNPWLSANLFSILSFSWMGDLFATGSKRPLQNSDMFPLADEQTTEWLTERLEENWTEECGRPSGQGMVGWRLFRALLRMFHWTGYACLLSMALISAVFNVLQPVLLSMLLTVVMNPSPQDKWKAYAYGLAICFCPFTRLSVVYQLVFKSQLVAMQWKSALVGHIFKKVRLFCTMVRFRSVLNRLQT